MGGQSKPTLLEIPGTEGVNGGNNQAVQSLLNLMNAPAPLQATPASMKVPLQQIAGLTGNEQTVQNLLAEYLGTSATDNEAYKLGMGEISKTLGGEFYDPVTSDFWKGYRETSQIEQEKGVSDIRRRGQLGGGLYSEPNQRTEADYVKGMGAERTMQLGGLYENERNRKSNAVNQALGYAGFEEQGVTNRLGLGSTIGAVPREIQNQKYQASYNQKLGQETADYNTELLSSQNAYNQQLFPYTAQAAIAQTLLPQWSVPGQDQGSGFLGLLGTLGSAMIKGK
jgi:hypothetical protein